MADLLVIVPTRGRPDNIDRLICAWRSTTTGCADLLIAIDDDDPADYPWRDVDGVFYAVGPRMRLGPTLNHSAVQFAPKYPYLSFFGDDHCPRTYGWDLKVCESLAKSEPRLCYGDDLLQGERLPTAVFMTSDIVTALGYMVPPGLIHLFVDDSWLALGRALNAITYMPNVVIEHVHPFAGKAEMDEGYLAVNNEAMVTADKATYEAWVENDLASAVEKIRALV